MVRLRSPRWRFARDTDIKEMLRHQYQEVLTDNPNLIPFIIDTAGNLGPEAIKFINVLRHHRNSHITDSKFEKAFLTAITISLSNGLSDTNDAFFKTLE